MVVLCGLCLQFTELYVCHSVVWTKEWMEVWIFHILTCWSWSSFCS